jgi:hypothetical protein
VASRCWAIGDFSWCSSWPHWCQPETTKSHGVCQPQNNSSIHIWVIDLSASLNPLSKLTFLRFLWGFTTLISQDVRVYISDLTTDSSRQPIRLIELYCWMGRGPSLTLRNLYIRGFRGFPTSIIIKTSTHLDLAINIYPGVKEEPLTIRLYEIALPDRPEYEAMFYC